MDSFFELEKRCKKIQQKRLFKILFVLFLLVAIVVIIFYMFFKTSSKTSKIIKPKQIKTLKIKKIEQNETKVLIPKKEKKIKEQNKTIKKEIKQEIKAVQPKKIIPPKKEINKTKEENRTIIEPILKLNINFENIQSSDVKNVKPELKKELKKPIQQKKEINKTKSSLLKNETITFDKAYILAQNYYDNGDFENSMKWCKIASKIDNTNEKIWYLYALNLEKLGQQEKAIKILKTYLKFRDSQKINLLLQRLEK